MTSANDDDNTTKSNDNDKNNKEDEGDDSHTQYVILFYKYHPLTTNETLLQDYTDALETLCRRLDLVGRILVGASKTEGINGTLAGNNRYNVKAFTYALLPTSHDDQQQHLDNDNTLLLLQQQAVDEFKEQSKAFFERIGEDELVMESPDDFKWSVKRHGVVSSKQQQQQQQQQKVNDDGHADADADDAHVQQPAPPLFPDLHIKIVKELIGTGGVLASITLDKTAQGYLTPKQWHEHLTRINNIQQQQQDDNNSNDNDIQDQENNVVLIDCRNTKEYDIGHFVNAVNPQTTTYSQFPQWVKDTAASPLLSGSTGSGAGSGNGNGSGSGSGGGKKKTVYMYCTGGIRCEKASAYIRQTVPNIGQVYHLKGGIHKYLEEFGHMDNTNAHDDNINTTSPSSLWQGRNFVFDGRFAVSPEETQRGKNGTVGSLRGGRRQAASATTSCTPAVVVGRCVYCQAAHDTFEPNTVCTVCRELVLVCNDCNGNNNKSKSKHKQTSSSILEFHCRNHFHLRHCYFTNLDQFDNSIQELQKQLDGLQEVLQEIAIGRRFRQPRRTIIKQMQRVVDRIQEIQQQNSSSSNNHDSLSKSTKSKQGTIPSLQQQHQQQQLIKKLQLQGGSSNNNSKKQVDDVDDDEVVRLGFLVPPSTFRDAATGIRVPPCVTRTLSCTTKAKWCGRSILQMIQHEFVELAQTDTLQQVLQHGLLRLNHNNSGNSNNIQQPPLDASNVARIKLKSSDTISRVIHWHEAPVLVPDTIPVQAVQLDQSVMQDYDITHKDDAIVYVCNKPSSVPVHPAGPYLANSLTVMMEGQLGLSSRSLKPIHRTDRVTSGLTLCCTSPMASRAFHKSLVQKAVDKLYLAKVHGKFPSTAHDIAAQATTGKNDDGTASWDEQVNAILVDAPIYTSNPANGLRIVSSQGKPSQSLFQRLSYNEESNTSLLACCPLTGRNHQLRVHLQWLGFSILDDVQYGGHQTMAMNGGCSSAAIDLMRNASKISSSTTSLSASLVNADLEAAAKKACRCCRDSGGPRACFTEAQLLEQGHMIHLHAWRYRVTILERRKNQPLSTVTFQVDPPAWAETDHLQHVSWLSQMATLSNEEES